MAVRQLYVDLVQLGYAEESIRGVVGLFQHSSFTDSFEFAPTYRQEIKFNCAASVYSFPLMPSDTDKLYEIVLYSKRGEVCRLFFSMPDNDAYLHQLETYTTPNKGNILIRKRFTDLEDTPNQHEEGGYLVSRQKRLVWVTQISADDIDLTDSLLKAVLDAKADKDYVDNRFITQNQTIDQLQDAISQRATVQFVNNALSGTAQKTEITTEIQRATTAEQALDLKINNEILRAKQEEERLLGEIDSIRGGYYGGFGTLAELQTHIPDKANSVAEVLDDPSHNPLADPPVLVNGAYYFKVPDGQSLENGSWVYGNSDTQMLLDRIDEEGQAAKNYTENAVSSLKDELSTLQEFTLSNTEKNESISTYGNYIFNNTMFAKLMTVNPDTSNQQYLRELKITGKSLKLGRLDQVIDGNLISNYADKEINTLTTKITVNVRSKSVAFLFGNASDYNEIYNSNALSVCTYDSELIIPALSATSADDPADVSLFTHPSGLVALSVPSSVFAAANIDTKNTAQLIAWLRTNYSVIHARYRQNASHIENNIYEKAIETLSIDSSDNIVFQIDIYGKITKESDLSVVTFANNAAYVQYATSVRNSSQQNRENELVELKIDLPVGLVYSDEQIIVRDNLFNEYECQFCADLHVNLRKEKSEGFHSDGSFKSGSIYFYDTLAIDEIKRYKVYAYGSKVRDIQNNLEINAGETVDIFSIYDLNLHFANTKNTTGVLLSTINKNNIDFNVESRARLTLRPSSAYVPIDLLNVKSRQITARGSIFCDVVFELSNIANSSYNLVEDKFKTTMIYRIFSNGIIKIIGIHGVNIDVAASELFGMYQQFNITNYSDTAFKYSSIYRHAKLNKDDINLDIVHRFAQGDIHRDGATYGPSRAPLTTMIVGENSAQTVCGWRHALSATPTWPIEKDYVWYSEINLLLQNEIADSKELLDYLFNTPSGFCGSLTTSQAKKRILINQLEDLVIGQTDFLYSDQGQEAIGSFSSTSSSRVFDAELYMLIKFNEGDFDDIYSRFITMLRSRFGTDLTQIGAKWTSGNLLLQFESRYTTPALCWLYYESTVRNDVDKIEMLKVITKSLTDAFKAYAATYLNVGIPLTGNDNGVGGNSNSNGSAMRIIALAIVMGLDEDSSLLSLYDDLEKYFIDTSTFMPVLNFVNETRDGVVTIDRYLHYIMYALNGYVQSALLLNRSFAFDVSQYTRNGFNANGDPRDYEWCRSESRRGIRGTIGFAIITLLDSKQEGNINGALKLIESIQRNSFDNEAKPKRCLDFYYVLSKQGTETVGTEVSFNIHSMCDVLFNYHYRLIK